MTLEVVTVGKDANMSRPAEEEDEVVPVAAVAMVVMVSWSLDRRGGGEKAANPPPSLLLLGDVVVLKALNGSKDEFDPDPPPVLKLPATIEQDN